MITQWDVIRNGNLIIVDYNVQTGEIVSMRDEAGAEIFNGVYLSVAEEFKEWFNKMQELTARKAE